MAFLLFSTREIFSFAHVLCDVLSHRSARRREKRKRGFFISGERELALLLLAAGAIFGSRVVIRTENVSKSVPRNRRLATFDIFTKIISKDRQSSSVAAFEIL